MVLNLLEDALKVTFPSQAKINWKEIHKEKLPKKLKKEKIRKLKSELKDKEITEKNIRPSAICHSYQACYCSILGNRPLENEISCLCTWAN